MVIQSHNPYTQKTEQEFQTETTDSINHKLHLTQQAQSEWKHTNIQERTQLLHKMATLLRNNAKQYGTVMSQEMGKTITEAIAEAQKCAWLCEYYAAHADKMLKNQDVQTEATHSYVTFEPLGIVFAIMPWNFPFWQVFRCAVPSILAGNACVLKHASNVPQCALNIQEIFEQSGFPKHIFTTLLASAQQAMDIIAHDQVHAVSLTGSNKAGQSIGEIAGKHVKEMVLELGGAGPFIVLEDANIKKAAEIAIKARMINNGQSCIAAKRFIVHKNIADEFTRECIQHVQSLILGDPLDEKTNIGPVAQEKFQHDLLGQLKDATDKGAQVHFGQEAPNTGYFVRPCIVTNTTQDMKICHEEVFGPIAPIIVVESEEQAIHIANSTEFGLGAALWTNNLQKAQQLIPQLQHGTVVINSMVVSDPRLPFGGTKKSGVGRELSHYGLKEFVNIKTVNIFEVDQ